MVSHRRGLVVAAVSITIVWSKAKSAPNERIISAPSYLFLAKAALESSQVVSVTIPRSVHIPNARKGIRMAGEFVGHHRIQAKLGERGNLTCGCRLAFPTHLRRQLYVNGTAEIDSDGRQLPKTVGLGFANLRRAGHVRLFADLPRNHKLKVVAMKPNCAQGPVILLWIVAISWLWTAVALGREVPVIERVESGRFRALTEPPCSYCSTQRRKGIVRDGDRVLAWLRTSHNGGAVPLRHFLDVPWARSTPV